VTRVLFAAGGTGGHVYPALATAAALARRHPQVEIGFVGTEGRFEARAVPQAGWPLLTVDALPYARRVSPELLRMPLVLVGATRTVRRAIRDQDVRAAAVFGGYVSVPLVLAARSMRVPIVVHEQNSVPGMANRLAARWAVNVAASFPASTARFRRPERVVVTGNPVRPGFAAIDRAAERERALARFDLKGTRRTLLAFGGSQGARRINEALVAAAGHWSEPATTQILHVAGRSGFEAASAAWERAAPGGPLVRCVPFVEDMESAYAAADVALSRAGASTLAELTLLGLPSVLVPFPHATEDHQTANARDLAAAGGALLVADAELDGPRLVAAVEPLLRDSGARGRMSAAASAFARPHAADDVAALIARAAGLDAARAAPDPGGSA
jgi:UDP-N-acetylglucosamine--N-acetylmuramyl-(pentapeptide) pyrophosphoryl-undecaprenol N-acetylglucosamine transferase